MEVRYLDLHPRLLFGSNVAPPWGYLHRELSGPAGVLWALRKPAMLLIAPELMTNQDTSKVDVIKEPSLQGIRIPLRKHTGTIDNLNP